MSGVEAEKCPVDHKTREKWLEAARSRQQESSSSSQSQALTNHDRIRQHPLHPARFSLDTGRWQPLSPLTSSDAPNKRPRHTLPTDREVSTIPRAISDLNNLNSAEAAALPSNLEKDTGHDRESGNWIYPSQQMFFAAMQRKGHNPHAPDMQTIVPIHNAVNERAWAEIKTWETGQDDSCGGPKLVSFAGDSKALTPRARWRTWVMGYKEPFDRHDWVVERCGGEKVEYVIDFYEGKKGVGDAPVSFFLDVRPKLNSWAGVRTRVGRAVGI